MQNPFDNIPEINFVPKTVDELLDEMVSDYEQEYYRITGEKKSLVPASEDRIFLYTQAARFHTAYQLIDRGCKMNLLKYSEGDYLDNLAALFGIHRLPAQHSVSRARFTLSATQAKDTRIPAGTRLSTPEGVYFSTDADTLIPAGELQGEVDITSQDTGEQTAGILVQQLSILVDPLPFVAEAVNIQPTQGGTAIQSDDSLRLQVYYFKDSYSVAGPESSYRYYVQSFSQAIEGISVYSPEPGVVDIRITLTGGELPEQPFLDRLMEYLEEYRPLTDNLNIAAPDKVGYAVDCTFYIARSDQSRQEEIQKRVGEAVEKYLSWQSGQIGRDITPDMLTKLVIEAGAKRVPITSPVFTPVDYHSVPIHGDVTVLYGGIEDD